MRNEFERKEQEKYERAQVAKEQVNKLIALDGIEPEDVAQTSAALEVNRTPKAPDLKMDPQKIDITISELEKRIEKNNLDPELGGRMIESLRVQKSISLNRAPSFAQTLRSAPSRVVDSVSNISLPESHLGGWGKFLVGTNVTCSALWGVVSGLNFSAGHTGTGWVDLGLSGMWATIGVLNYIVSRE